MTARISTTVFFPPKYVFIDEEEETHFASSGKITDLFKDLQTGLPVAYGHFGPSAYTKPARKLNYQLEQLDVFGWKKGSSRIRTAEKCYCLVLGGRRQENGDVVYYALAQDVTTTDFFSTRLNIPCETDKRIYAASVERFYENMSTIYPAKEQVTDFDREMSIIDSSSRGMKLPLPDIEILLCEKLSKFPLQYLSSAKNKKALFEIGQDLFAALKKETPDSRDVIKQMRRIVDSLAFLRPDGFKRMREIERIWEDVGDEHRRWG